MTDQVIEADVVDESMETTGHALVVAPRRSEVLRPLDVADQKAAMDLYQQGLRQILDDSDWQDTGRDGKFVKKSGWRKIAAWFDLSIELVRDHVERDENGQVTRAQVWARAVAASGRFADGDGYCDIAESRFARNKSKLENDLRGTATTRAINRAISNLVGMGAVSAEEIDGGPSVDSAHPFGPVAPEALGKAAKRACATITKGDVDAAVKLFKAVVADCGGYLPAGAAFALVQAARDPTAVEAPPVA